MSSKLWMSRTAFATMMGLVLVIGSIVCLAPETAADETCSWMIDPAGEYDFCMEFYSDPGLTNKVGTYSCDCDLNCVETGSWGPYRNVQYCFPCG